ACSETWAAVLKADGTAWAVGANAGSQQGHTLTPDEPGEFWPVAVAADLRQLFLAETGGLGITRAGDLVGWGPAWGSLANDELRAHPILPTLPDNIRGCSGLLGLGTERNPLFFDRYGTLLDSTNQPVELGLDGELTDVVAIAEGPNTRFAVTRDGDLYAWGENTYGQLGVGDTLPAHESPQLVKITRGFRRIACGLDPMHAFTLALLDDQTVASWGDNTKRQLARIHDGATPAIEPGAIPGLSGIIKLAAGSGHGLALDEDGDLYAWGDNTFGQLGTGNFDDADTPILVASGIADIAAGPLYTLVRRDNGAFAWCGQAPERDDPLTTLADIPGLTYDEPSRALDTSVDPASVGEFYPYAGPAHIAPDRAIPLHAEDTDRFAFAHWSDNVADPLAAETSITPAEDAEISVYYRYQPDAFAQLTVEPGTGGSVLPAVGTHDYEPGAVVTLRALPEAEYRFQRWYGDVSDPFSRVTTLVMDQDQTVMARFASLGMEPAPQIATGRVNAMEYDALILYSDSRVRNFGATGGGSDIPLNGEGEYLDNAVALAVGENHQLALAMDGTVWAWGDNTHGQCGTGTLAVDSYGFPQKVVEPDGNVLRGISNIAAGRNFSLALDPAGLLYSWGHNLEEQLGHSVGTDAVAAASPVLGADGNALTGIRSIACGAEFAMVAMADGTVLAWGKNDQNQLGRSTRRGEPVSDAVAGLPTIAKVAAGGACAGAVSADGEIWTWGDNTYGQLGHGTTGTPESPARVNSLPVIVQLAVGPDHMLALAADGTVWAWGRGEMGRLGNGDTADSAMPVQVLNAEGTAPLQGIRAIACHAYSYALTESGHLLQWGYDKSGPLGDPEPTPLPWERMSLGQPVGQGLAALSLASFPKDGGSVLPGEGLVFVNRGTLVEVQARPAEGYRFLGWAGDLSGNLPNTTVRLRENLAAIATFELADPLLRLAPVTLQPGQTDWLGLFLDGETAALEGVQLAMSAPDGLSFGPAGYGPNNGESSELSYAVPEPERARVVLADTDDEASLAVDEDEPLLTFELTAEPDCPPGTYTIRIDKQRGSSPVVAYAGGHLWQAARTEAGSVTVEPAQGLVLRLSAVALATESDSSEIPPSGPASLRSDREHYLELWLQDRRDTESPVEFAQIDLALPAGLEPLEVVAPGTADAVTGTIDEGTVTGFGGSPAVGTVLRGIWTCLARLRVQPASDGNLEVSLANAEIRLEDASTLTEPALAVQPDGKLSIAYADNSSPVAKPVPEVAVRWGAQITGSVSGSDDNPDDILTYTVVAGPSHGELIAFDPETGAFTYQPDIAYSGPDSFSFTVSDHTLTSAEAEQRLLISRGWAATIRRGETWCAFGQDDEAENGVDPLDLAADGDAAVFFEAPAAAGQLQRDLRRRSGSPVWRLRAIAAATETELSWDPLRVPDGLHLVQVVPNTDSQVLIDMRQAEGIALAANTDYAFDVALVETYTLQVDAGWNLVVFPGTPVHRDFARVFPQQSDSEHVRMYEWANGNYYAPNSLTALRGYWLYSDAPAAHEITTLPVFEAELELAAGWNLIGVPFPTDPPYHEAIAGAVWGFNDGQYQRMSRLLPGSAYWIFAHSDCTITLEDEAAQ
ncbi:MAG: InlB B-repeat-containing protein, partial [Verrucomicrobiota bacterium]